MVAELYLVAESFENNTKFSTPEIENKVKSLADDFNLIRLYRDTNRLLVHPEIYNTYFLNGVLLSDILFNPIEAREYLERDIINALQKIIIESEETENSSQEVIEVLLPEHNEDICHGLVAFNSLPDIQPEFQIIYHLQGWLNFRRYFLGLYPKDSDYYIDECTKYFPNLYFHSRNKHSINEIFPEFSKSILKHLGYLNDVFYTYRTRSFPNESEKYRTLSIECQLEEYAASKDNNSAKEELTYQFEDDNGNNTLVTCYPHLRLCNSDAPGDTRYYQNRIYFHEGIPEIKNGNILIGHIGKHRE